MKIRKLERFLIFLAFLAPILAIPIDNGVEGDPEIECGSNSIAVSFNTRNPFEGFVYVKGQVNQQGCRNDQTGGRVATISLPFDSCNVQRVRSLNPRGIFVTTTVVITFHPKFETKVDRAFRIQCFYMEADKTVSAELEVSGLTTGFISQLVPMPVCRYEILDGGPNGAPVRYALIGQQIYHKWTCDTETVDTFCMRVHSCFVDDGNGDRVNLLNEEGCAQDRYLLRNLEYLTDLMAGQEAHVFKYADRAELFFQCQIAITIKEPNSQCPHPQCAEPTAGRKRRSVDKNFLPEESAGTVDVVAKFESFDLDNDNSPLNENGPLLGHRMPKSFQDFRIQNQNANFCFSSVGFSFFVAVILLIFVSFVTIFVVCLMNRSKTQ